MISPKPYREERPWGEELWITGDKPSMVKILSIEPHQELSLQFHHNRDEFWHIVSGDGSAVIGEETLPINVGSDLFVSKGTKHRLIGGNEKLIILEIAFGDFDEKDIVRLEDDYGRK